MKGNSHASERNETKRTHENENENANANMFLLLLLLLLLRLYRTSKCVGEEDYRDKKLLLQIKRCKSFISVFVLFTSFFFARSLACSLVHCFTFSLFKIYNPTYIFPLIPNSLPTTIQHQRKLFKIGISIFHNESV